MRIAVAALLAAACDAPPAAPEAWPERRACTLRVTLEPDTHPAQVSLVSPAGIRRGLQREGEGWAGDFDLGPGRHLYLLEVDGRPMLDPGNPVSAREAGVEYSLAELPSCEAPAWRLVGREPLRFRLQRAEAPLATASAAAGDVSVPVEIAGDDVTLDPSGLPHGRHRICVNGTDADGRPVEPTCAPLWVEPSRFRWADAQIYQVVLDRFAGDAPFTPADRVKPPGHRAGGHLRGLLRVLRSGYFEGLGVNVLWISPLNENPDGLWSGVEGGRPRYEGYHGYWPIAPRGVEPAFGTEADVEALVAEAHARGIRVVVDVVLNHVHHRHPYVEAHPDWFNRACACGSPRCPWWSHIETCWFTPYLPDLSWDSTEALDTQIDDALWWIERFDLDGLRVDAVPMMPRFVSRRLTAEVHRRFQGAGTRIYLLGETFTGPESQDLIRWYLGPYGLDGQFDFPLMWALREAFAWETAPLWKVADVWRASEAAWAGSTAVMATMVGNHDVTRFVSEAAGQVDPSMPDQAWRRRPPVPDDPSAYARLLLAQTFVLTAPGAPILYYGDEFGMPGVGDPDNRRPMRFGGERSPLEGATAARIARLGRLRRCLPALRRGRLQMLRAERERLVYLREGEWPAVVVLPRLPQNGTVRIELPAEVPDVDFIDALSGVRVARTEAGLAPLTLPARTPAVLIPATHACAEGLQ